MWVTEMGEQIRGNHSRYEVLCRGRGPTRDLQHAPNNPPLTGCLLRLNFKPDTTAEQLAQQYCY